jgi:adenine-specific DNA-methyltransferase
MNEFFEALKNLLKKDERLVDKNSEILKNKTIELALALDKNLIKLLLSDQKTKARFFVEVNGVLVFDKDTFIKFISNKQFLPDSYTSFKNKIGLIDEKEEFISEKKEVVLSWPYKDCVLEAGMTKEDQKRDEIFWNEILAPDQITRLFEPKVFTNAKRIDKNGEHSLCHPELGSGSCFKTDEKGDIKDNLIIKGNNLLVLHSLKKRFAGKVKLIYIDPPYNTGGEANIFTYNNSFNHSSWLTFIKNRLETAKEFLRKDGFIAITIDHNELFYIGEIADEIFSRENRLGVITIVIKPEGRQFAKFFAVTNEFMLVYAKDINLAKFEDVIIDEKEKEKFDRKDDKGSYKLRLYLNYNKPEISGRDVNPEGWYPFYVSKDLKTITLDKKSGYTEVWPIDNGVEKSWQTSKKTAQERILAGEIVCEKNKKGELEIFFKDREHQRYLTHWFDSKYNATHYGTRLLEKTLGEKVKFSYPKSLYSVLDTLKIMTKGDDIILDFFAGSGTTGHATLELNKEDGGNRKFILVEQLEEHIKVCKERIQKVMQKENIKDDFVYLELMKWNENFAEKIKEAKTKDELKKLWETIKEKAFLSYKVDVKTIDKNAKDFEDLSLEDQKRFLLECLDNNHLYVSYSEIDDEEYGVSEEDKKLNREFYED